jgi:hypothetical protein
MKRDRRPACRAPFEHPSRKVECGDFRPGVREPNRVATGAGRDIGDTLDSEKYRSQQNCDGAIPVTGKSVSVDGGLTGRFRPS